MRVLHLACMPFPSPQGTQAAVNAMLEALAAAGEDVALLVYGAGAGDARTPYPLWRLPALSVGRSLRSGPSGGKVALDALMIGRTRALVRREGAALVVAHHVEAALVATAARVPFAFVAHTALDAELGYYAPRALGPAAAVVGAGLDAMAAARARACASVAPALEARLRAERGLDAPHLPIPWAVPVEIAPRERGAARARWGLAPAAPVLLYAGNLDAYQGFEDVVDALAHLAARRPDARLLVATASDPAPLARAARRREVAHRVVVAPLADEDDRRRAHAAADVALVPRRAPGGLPVKLLDALARGVPVVASRRAAAGLALGRAALLAADDDPRSLAIAAELALAPATAEELAREGRAYVARDHAPARFVGAYRAFVARALTSPARSAPPPGSRRRADRAS